MDGVTKTRIPEAYLKVKPFLKGWLQNGYSLIIVTALEQEMYRCQQKIIIAETEEECDSQFAEHILKPRQQFIGLDCEWNHERPISLLQVATPDVVILVRTNKTGFTLSNNIKLVLEDPSIYKVGVGIDSDAEKLMEDCGCRISSWVDMRYIALHSKSFGPAIISQALMLEELLKHVDQSDKNSESYKIAAGRRLSFFPRVGLEHLVSTCFTLRLPKNTSARYQDDWEAKTLRANQRIYAANDACCALDICVALVYASINDTELPLELGKKPFVSAGQVLPLVRGELEKLAEKLREKKFLQTKDDIKLICLRMEDCGGHPDLDVTLYYPREKPSKKRGRGRRENSSHCDSDNTASSTPNTCTASDMMQEQYSTPASKTYIRDDSLYRADSGPAFSTDNTSTDNNSTSSLEGKTCRRSLEYIALQNRYKSDLPVLWVYKHVHDRRMPTYPVHSLGRGDARPEGYHRPLYDTRPTQTDVRRELMKSEECILCEDDTLTTEVECGYSDSYTNTKCVCKSFRTSSVVQQPSQQHYSRVPDSRVQPRVTAGIRSSGTTRGSAASETANSTRGPHVTRGEIPAPHFTNPSSSRRTDAPSGRGRPRTSPPPAPFTNMSGRKGRGRAALLTHTHDTPTNISRPSSLPTVPKSDAGNRFPAVDVRYTDDARDPDRDSSSKGTSQQIPDRRSDSSCEVLQPVDFSQRPTALCSDLQTKPVSLHVFDWNSVRDPSAISRNSEAVANVLENFSECSSDLEEFYSCYS